MIYRTLGNTGETVSAIGLGGWHLSLKHVDENLAIRITRTALDEGITFLDNSWDYNEGASEIRMGKALRDGYRSRAFVMTKVDGRTEKEATKQLDESLKRLGVDCIDLVQFHEIIRYEDADRIFDDEGAHMALLKAREKGKIRFIGFTGHKDPHIHLYMLEVADRNGFSFDTVQMPLNVMDAHFRSFEKLVLPQLVKEKIGVLGMKSLANGAILKSNTVTAVECLHYALNLPTCVVITGIDSMDVLKQALDAAHTFRQLSASEVNTLLMKTAEAASNGYFEPFKTSALLDSTAKNLQWLGDEERQEMQQLMPLE
jgi:aryl-alcohol dehydrogenase-like predicted oxidoreductase